MVLILLSISLIHLAKRLEHQSRFKKIDRIFGAIMMLVLLVWGVLEIFWGKASFFLINLKPLTNVSREQNPALFWVYGAVKFYFASSFFLILKRISRRFR